MEQLCRESGHIYLISEREFAMSPISMVLVAGPEPLLSALRPCGQNSRTEAEESTVRDPR